MAQAGRRADTLHTRTIICSKTSDFFPQFSRMNTDVAHKGDCDPMKTRES